MEIHFTLNTLYTVRFARSLQPAPEKKPNKLNACV